MLKAYTTLIGFFSLLTIGSSFVLLPGSDFDSVQSAPALAGADFTANGTNAALDLGWVRDTQTRRTFSVEDGADIPRNNFLPDSTSGSDGDGFVIANTGRPRPENSGDYEDGFYGATWNLFTAPGDTFESIAVDVAVLTSFVDGGTVDVDGDATTETVDLPSTSNAAEVGLVVYGFTGDEAALQTELTSTSVNTRLDPANGLGSPFDLLVDTTLGAPGSLDSWEQQIFNFSSASSADFYLVGFYAQGNQGVGVGLDNVGLIGAAEPPINPGVVPEPGTLAVGGAFILVLGFIAIRRRRAKAQAE